MTDSPPPVILAVLLITEILGLLSAALARLSEGSSYQAFGQRFFLTCLGLLGVTTMIALILDPACWLSSGATFAMMVLAATCDFSHGSRARRDWPAGSPEASR